MSGQPSKIRRKTSTVSSVSEELDARAAAKSFLTIRNGGIALLYLITFFLISPPPRLSWVDDVEEGVPHDSKNILAQVDFEVIDEEATRLAKEHAASLEPPVYVIDPDLLLSSISDAEKQFDKIRQDALNPLFSEEERIALLSKYLHSSTSESTLTLLAGLDQEGFDLLRSSSLNAIEVTQSKGILRDVPGGAKNISIYDGSAVKWRLAKVDDVLTLNKAVEELKKIAHKKFPESAAYRDALVELSTPFIGGTLRFDEMLTEEARNDAIKSTPSVTRTIKKGDLIVGTGQPVMHQDKIELRAHARALGRASLVNLKRYVGNGLLLLMVFGCFLFYLRRYLPEVLQNNKSLLLIAIMVLITLGTSWLFIVFSLPSAWLYLVPVAAGAILLSILANDRMALVYSFFISVLYAAQGNYQLSFFLLGIFGSLAGIYYMRAIRRRSDVMRPGLAVGVVNLITIIILYLIGILQENLLWAILAGTGNGLLTAIGVVPGTLSVLEWALGIVTNIRLLELSDLNHPLLKQMAMHAPGTYHHSLMVGNLAEAAAEEIGANSLLARVGSYYHDVGKMRKPAYFSENQRGSKNKHDELTPSMSALVLTAHEKEGVELAREHKLNQPIIDFIEQHHGTSLMTFFYQKAMEQAGGGDVDDDIFRYPGPRPQTREIAICMLADSVEAASRTLTNPTHGRIKAMVQKIVNNKFVDAQLYDCDLTLKDINGITGSFVRTLAGYLHSRIEYPEEQTIPEIKEKFEDSNSKIGAKSGSQNRSNKESN